MKTKLFFLSAVFMLLISSTLATPGNRGASLTVCDGTDAINTIPVYTNEFLSPQRTQICYPENLLTSMMGRSISSMTFYTNYSSVYSTDGAVKISLLAADTNLSNGFVSASFTEVYNGYLTFTEEMTINFATEFPYNGGNLIIQFDNPLPNDAPDDVIFFGLHSNTVTALLQYWANFHGTHYAQEEYDFLPKVTFDYGGDAGVCLAPYNLAVSNITTTAATIAWEDEFNHTAWTIDCNGTEYQAASNPFTLTNLQPGRQQTVKIKAHCEDNEESNWSYQIIFHTDCEEMVVVTEENPFFESFEYIDIFDGCWTVEAESNEPFWAINNHVLIDHDEDDNPFFISPIDGNKTAVFVANGEYITANLISPLLDVSAVTDVKLAFYCVKADWVGDLNSLTVYYRTNLTESWKFLYIDGNIAYSWERTELSILENSDTLQIAFEGYDDFGYPIGIDSLLVWGIAAPVDPIDTVEPVEPVDPIDPETAIADAAAHNISIYPNPAYDVLHVRADGFQTLEIVNFLGQVVSSANITSSHTQINVSDLQAGVYFARLKGEGKVVTQKFVRY